MDVDFGLLGLLLVAEIVAIPLAAFVIGVVLRWVSDWRHGRSPAHGKPRPISEVIRRVTRR